jgi:hypothetical protein
MLLKHGEAQLGAPAFRRAAVRRTGRGRHQDRNHQTG